MMSEITVLQSEIGLERIAHANIVKKFRQKVTQLEADKVKLREALEWIVDEVSYHKIIAKARKALEARNE